MTWGDLRRVKRSGKVKWKGSEGIVRREIRMVKGECKWKLT
jgi:hypothetical protein